jgi:hypothetical protein
VAPLAKSGQADPLPTLAIRPSGGQEASPIVSYVVLALACTVETGQLGYDSRAEG